MGFLMHRVKPSSSIAAAAVLDEESNGSNGNASYNKNENMNGTTTANNRNGSRPTVNRGGGTHTAKPAATTSKCKRSRCRRFFSLCWTSICLSWCVFLAVFITTNISLYTKDDALIIQLIRGGANKEIPKPEVIPVQDSGPISPEELKQQSPQKESSTTSEVTITSVAEGLGQNNGTTEFAKPITKRGDIHHATWQEITQTKAIALASLQSDDYYVPPDPPVQLIRLFNSAANNSTAGAAESSHKPIVAIVTSTRSTARTAKATDTMLWKYLIKSITSTITQAEREQWRIRLYVAVDDIDLWWLQHCHELVAGTGGMQIPPWLQVTFGVYKKRNHHIPFNEMARTAYQEGAEYFCRVNDDTEFKSNGWISQAVGVLRSYDPPNIGVVGPLCEQGNIHILTHDFVHRHHLEIFRGLYYPAAFNNWYLDDWISFVYSSTVLGDNFHRFTVLKSWKVKHWVFAKRYNTNTVDAQWLPAEYERGRQLIRSYLKEHFSNGTTVQQPVENLISESLPTPKLQDPRFVEAVLSVLPENGNLLVWSLDTDSHFWHRATSGRVVFLNDHQMGRNRDVTAAHPYLEIYDARHEAVERGSLKAQEANFQQCVVGQTLEHNTWCDLEMAQFAQNVKDTTWDVILVDAPVPVYGVMEGIDETGPGVFQSLYMTKKLVASQTAAATNATIQTHIFVDHYERRYEKEFSARLFGKEPMEVLSTDDQQEHAHFVIEKNDRVAQNIPRCTPPPVRDETRFSNKEWAPKHVKMIFDALPRKGNMLVWGIDKSSVHWHQATQGRVIFLDDLDNSKTDYEKIHAEHPKMEIHRVHYSTLNTATLQNKLLGHPDQWEGSLTMDESTHKLPKILFEIPWDVILVAGPNPADNRDPGKFQSLFMTRTLANNSQKLGTGVSHVFVKNFERPIESKFSKEVYAGEPTSVVKDKISVGKKMQPVEQAHFMLGDRAAIVAYKEKALARSRSSSFVDWKFVGAEDAAPASPLKSPASWVVLLQLNSGFYDLFLNWLSFYNKLDLGIDVVVVAEDDAIKEKLEVEVLPISPNVRVERSSLDVGDLQAFDYDAENFNRIVATRASHIQSKLQAGTSVIYTDVDTVWRMSPLPYLAAVGGDEVDLIAHVDAEENNGVSPYYGTGFLAMVANDRIIRFMSALEKEFQSKDPQLFQPLFNEFLHQITLVRHQALPATEFPSGQRYFADGYDERNATVVVHNNYILGHDPKVFRFKELKLWDPLAPAVPSEASPQ